MHMFFFLESNEREIFLHLFHTAYLILYRNGMKKQFFAFVTVNLYIYISIYLNVEF